MGSTANTSIFLSDHQRQPFRMSPSYPPYSQLPNTPRHIHVPPTEALHSQPQPPTSHTLTSHRPRSKSWIPCSDRQTMYSARIVSLLMYGPNHNMEGRRKLCCYGYMAGTLLPGVRIFAPIMGRIWRIRRISLLCRSSKKKKHIHPPLLQNSDHS